MEKRTKRCEQPPTSSCRGRTEPRKFTIGDLKWQRKRTWCGYQSGCLSRGVGCGGGARWGGLVPVGFCISLPWGGQTTEMTRSESQTIFTVAYQALTGFAGRGFRDQSVRILGLPVPVMQYSTPCLQSSPFFILIFCKSITLEGHDGGGTFQRWRFH
ncbi:hypothetical protein H4582DRAFT_524211 [Lactarius indigo]|nr:hypothetical protein H4582DRAFT_524211 [Lactarius indigo]